MDDFEYSDIRNPAWAIRAEGVNLTGRMWLWCEVFFTSGSQIGRWSAIVIEHDNTDSPAMNEIYTRCMSGEFGLIAELPPEDMPIGTHMESQRLAGLRKPCIDLDNCGMG